MFANIDDFLKELNNLKHEFLPEPEIETIYKRTDKISLRVLVSSVYFIDIYVNVETNRYDFSLIKNNKRIFGYDNLGGWHYHPLNKQDDHIVATEPSLEQIFREIADIIRTNKQS